MKDESRALILPMTYNGKYNTGLISFHRLMKMLIIIGAIGIPFLVGYAEYLESYQFPKWKVFLSGIIMGAPHPSKASEIRSLVFRPSECGWGTLLRRSGARFGHHSSSTKLIGGNCESFCELRKK